MALQFSLPFSLPAPHTHTMIRLQKQSIRPHCSFTRNRSVFHLMFGLTRFACSRFCATRLRNPQLLAFNEPKLTLDIRRWFLLQGRSARRRQRPDALAGRPLSSSRRFLIDSVVAIIGGGEGAIVVVPLALIVGFDVVYVNSTSCVNNIMVVALFAVFLHRFS